MVAGNNQTQLWLRNHHRGVLAFSDCRFCSEMQRKSPEFTVQSEKTDHCFCVFCSKLSAAVKSILFPTITLRVLPWTETLLPPSDLHEQRRQTCPRHLRPPTYCFPPLDNYHHRWMTFRESMEPALYIVFCACSALK